MLAFTLRVVLGSRFVVGFVDSCLPSGCLSSFQDAEASVHGANLGLLQVVLKKERHVDDVDNEFMQWLSNNSLTLLQGQTDNPIVHAGALKDLQSYWSNVSQDQHEPGDSKFADLQEKQHSAFLQEVKTTSGTCNRIVACPASAPENRGSGVSCSVNGCDAATCCKPKDMNQHDMSWSHERCSEEGLLDIDIDRCKVLDGRKFQRDSGLWTLYYREVASTEAIKFNSCYVSVISYESQTAHVTWNAAPSDSTISQNYPSNPTTAYMCTKQKAVCGAWPDAATVCASPALMVWRIGKCEWSNPNSCTRQACCRSQDWVIPHAKGKACDVEADNYESVLQAAGVTFKPFEDLIHQNLKSTGYPMEAASPKALCENLMARTLVTDTLRSGGTNLDLSTTSALNKPDGCAGDADVDCTHGVLTTITSGNAPKGCSVEENPASTFTLRWRDGTGTTAHSDFYNVCYKTPASCDTFYACSGSLPVNKGKGYYCMTSDENSCTAADCCRAQDTIVNLDDLYATRDKAHGCAEAEGRNLEGLAKCQALVGLIWRRGDDATVSSVVNDFDTSQDITLSSEVQNMPPTHDELCGCYFLLPGGSQFQTAILRYNGHRNCQLSRTGSEHFYAICEKKAKANCGSYTCTAPRPVPVPSTTECYGGMQRSCTAAICCRPKGIYAGIAVLDDPGGCDSPTEYILNETVCRGLAGENVRLWADEADMSSANFVTMIGLVDPFVLNDTSVTGEICGCSMVTTGPIGFLKYNSLLPAGQEVCNNQGVGMFSKANERAVCLKPKANCASFKGCWGTKPINVGAHVLCADEEERSCDFDTCCRAQAFYAFKQTHCRTGEMITDQATCQRLGGSTLYTNSTDGKRGFLNYRITWVGSVHKEDEACGCYGDTDADAESDMNIRYNTNCPTPAITPRNYAVCLKLNATCDEMITSCPMDKPDRKKGVKCPTWHASSCTAAVCCQLPATSDYYATGNACPTGHHIKDSLSCQALNGSFIYNGTKSRHFFNVLWTDFSFILNASRSSGCGCYLRSDGWKAQMYWNSQSCDKRDTQFIKDLIVCKQRSTCDTYKCPATLPIKKLGSYCPSLATTSCTDSSCCEGKPLPPQTALTKTVEVGAKTLHVANVDRFEIAEHVLIKSSKAEANVITGIGSLLLKYPLKFSHTTWTTVTQLPPDDPKIKDLLRKPSLYGKTVELPNWSIFPDVLRYYSETAQVLKCQHCEAFTLSHNKCPTYGHDLKIAQSCEQCEEWLRDACAAFPPEGYEKVGEGKCVDPWGGSGGGIQTDYTADNPYNCKALCESSSECTSFETNEQGCKYHLHLKATKADGSKGSTCYAKAAAKKKAFFR